MFNFFPQNVSFEEGVEVIAITLEEMEAKQSKVYIVRQTCAILVKRFKQDL